MPRNRAAGTYRTRGTRGDRKVHRPLLEKIARNWGNSTARAQAISRLAAMANLTEAEAAKLV